MPSIKVTLRKLRWINSFTARLLELHGLTPSDLRLSQADLIKYANEGRDIDELIKELMGDYTPATPTRRLKP